MATAVTVSPLYHGGGLLGLLTGLSLFVFAWNVCVAGVGVVFDMYCPGVHDSAVVQQRVNQGNMKGRARVVGCCCWQCIGAENAVY
jgi:hypothetical protein